MSDTKYIQGRAVSIWMVLCGIDDKVGVGEIHVLTARA